jgi:DNA-binding MarR family transcriptional regulator
MKKKSFGRSRLFPPLTVSAPGLIIDGTDDEFRRLVDNLILFAGQIQNVRQVLSSAMGVSQPQYNILMIVARDKTNEGMSIKELAEHMKVTPSFAVIETNKLMTRGYLYKRTSLGDRRRINLQLTEKATRLIKKVGPLQRQVNNKLFGGLAKNDFKSLAHTISALIAGYEPALDEAKKYSVMK